MRHQRHAYEHKYEESTEDKTEESKQHSCGAKKARCISISSIEVPLIDTTEAVNILLQASQRPVSGSYRATVCNTIRNIRFIINRISIGIERGLFRDAQVQNVRCGSVCLACSLQVFITWISLAGSQRIFMLLYGNISAIFLEARRDALDGSMLTGIRHVMDRDIKLLVRQSQFCIDVDCITIVVREVARI